MRKSVMIFLVILSFQVCLYSQNDNPDNKFFYRGPYRTNEHWLFTRTNDTISGNWNYLPSLPHALLGVNSIYTPSINKIFICGGADSTATPTNKCYFYNLNTNAYETADTLPTARWLGKLVRVGDSLYLIGSSGSNFYYPDGAIYKYDINFDYWQIQTPMPAPYLIEPAVCVYQDTLIYHAALIVTIGGSTSGYSSPTDIIRYYNTSTNAWTTIAFPFYRPTTCSQAECVGEEIIVLGGLNGGNLYTDVINCIIQGSSVDSIGDPGVAAKQWGFLVNSPYPRGVYRIASGQFWGQPVFGPAIYSTLDTLLDFGMFYSFNFADSTWRRYMPNTLDSVGNISTIAIYPNEQIGDSIHFYIFGGNNNQQRVLNKAESYSFPNPFIGIHGISNSLPKSFKLYQNYPNPFNPATIINYEIPRAGDVRIFLYDILGREVRILLNEHQSAGKYSITFNGSNLASGVYFYKMISGDFSEAKKLVILK